MQSSDEPMGNQKRIYQSLASWLWKWFTALPCEPFREYPQTWYYMPKRRGLVRRGLRAALQWLCGKWGGHELSETEWGYGGGERVDRWCRWCDTRIQVPKEQSERRAPGTFRAGMDMVDSAEE